MTEVPGFVAHRFGRVYGPDSSRAALERALSGSIAGVETDCCLTADDQVVLLHDPLLDRASTASGWARSLPANAIVAACLRDASGEPTTEHPLLLSEALDAIAGRDLLVQLEIKASADEPLACRTAEVACEAVRAHPRMDDDRVEFISYWPAAAAAAAASGFRARIIVACAYVPSALATWARRHRVTGVVLEGHYFAEGPISAWRRAGLSVMSGVINDLPLLRRVLGYAPELVATDRPHEIREELLRELADS